jgi:hypothetical protein
MSKRTKKQIINELCDAESELEWLEYSHIPKLKEELSHFKLSKAEIYEFSLEDIVSKKK